MWAGRGARPAYGRRAKKEKRRRCGLDCGQQPWPCKAGYRAGRASAAAWCRALVPSLRRVTLPFVAPLNPPIHSVGSLFYAIYFFVSFPMFMRIDEEPGGKRWTLGQVCVWGGGVRVGGPEGLGNVLLWLVGLAGEWRGGRGPGNGGHLQPGACARHAHARQVALDALAAGMLVTILLDTWRIAFGGIVDSEKSRAGLTWAA